MADSVSILTAIRDHLISISVARKPTVMGPTGAHPLYIAPRDGAPAPGQLKGVEADADIVLSLFPAGGISTPRHERFRAIDIATFWIRSGPEPSGAVKALGMAPLLRGALHDKRNWSMGGVLMIETLEFTPFQPLGSDQDGYRYTYGVSCEYLTSDLPSQ